MLKVLIVDDDIFVYTNLKELIQWEKEGFVLCNAALNGMEAIRLIEKEAPDIVITDINMPGMNGVSLIQFIQEHHPQIKVLALSAYDDFEYVKQSLKMGAADYILKHTLTAEVLLNALHSLRETITDKKQEDETHQRLEEQIQTGRQVLQQKFIRTLLQGGMKDVTGIGRKMTDLNINLGLRNLVVVAGEIDDYITLEAKFTAEEINTLMKSMMDMSSEIFRDSGKAILSMVEEGKFVIIFSFDDLHSNQNIYNQVFGILMRIKTTIKRYLNITACFGLDGICDDIVNVSQYYVNAEKLLSQRFYEGKDRIFHDSSVVRTNNNLQILGIKEEKNILQCITSLQRDLLTNCINDIFEKIQQYQPGLSSTKMILITLINIANKIIRDSGIDNTRIFGDINDPYEYLNQFGTIADVKNWMMMIYERIMNTLELFCLNPQFEGVTRKAIEYIYKNYHLDLSLNDIAACVGVNSSYLSRKFKQDCGKGVIEYLNTLRIEQAKLLMENGSLKVKEIADQVGFNNYNYFFKVFKDSQGMTPLEYEKSCRG
jgi:two-component system, response regulator YesN